MGTTLTAGLGVVVKGKVLVAPCVTVTVIVPGEVVNVGDIEIWVAVELGGSCVGVLVAVITAGVLLGACVKVGRD